MDTPPIEYAYAHIKTHLSTIERPVIFELGMCDGYHTGLILSWCARNDQRYYGFEPDQRNVHRIVGMGIDRKINFFPHAMGNVTGTVPFHMATPEPNGAVGSSSISEFTPVLTQLWPWLRVQETVPVQAWRLDDFCAKHEIDHIDFIWMDVQGAERLVFEGAQNMIPKTSLIWTEYDGGTLYKDSSTLTDIMKYFPGWETLADCGGDVLIKNSKGLAA